MVALDIVGPLTYQGKTVNLLTMIDHFSRYAEVSILNSPTSKHVCAEFYVGWICRWGTPRRILTNNGKCFTSTEFRKFCTDNRIRNSYSSPYHPQANGLIESFHQTLNRGLSHMGATESLSLQEIIGSVLFAYRSTPHLATLETPSFLMTGTELVLPCHQEFVAWTAGEDIKEEDLKIRSEVLIAARRSCLERPILRRDGLTAKFLPSWSEPCKVVRVSGEEGKQLELDSLWYTRGSRKLVSATDVQLLSRSLSTAALNEWKHGFHSEVARTRHSRSIKNPNHSNKSTSGTGEWRTDLPEPIDWALLEREMQTPEQATGERGLISSASETVVSKKARTD
eukprot:GHVS01083279.1.p1 GENE.GHVS01083279.1~~GHVS01083279.1.p1  ORF type:complete len:339 (+),score=7.66 GHVS01083279.1:313-1329(+)